jgi:hypothetical protein
MKRPLSLVLAAALSLGLLALAPVTASAAVGIQAGLPTFTVNTASPTTVGLGGKRWAVIGYDGTGVASTSGTLTLLLANGYSYPNSAFDATSPYSNEYSGSSLRTAMETAYSGLPAKEQGLVVSRDLAGGSGLSYQTGYLPDNIAGPAVTGAKFWPLSGAEANAVDSALREYSAWWWLRSPGGAQDYAAIVHSDGSVGLYGTGVILHEGGVRPALRLNLSSVLFASDANGANAKSAATVGDGLVAAQVASTNVKFTVSDPSLTLGSVTATGQAGNVVNFDYAGASGWKTLSAVVLRGGAVLYYGKLANTPTSGSGSASVTLPSDFAVGDTVQIFVEEANGNYQTDFASAYKQLTVPNPPTPPPPAKGIFGANAKWYGEWWHYLLFFLCFGFIWMFF